MVRARRRTSSATAPPAIGSTRRRSSPRTPRGGISTTGERAERRLRDALHKRNLEEVIQVEALTVAALAIGFIAVVLGLMYLSLKNIKP